MISDLVIGQNIDDVFYCIKKTIGTTKNGDTYYTVTLQDKTGSVDGKIWEVTDLIEEFNSKDFVQVIGNVGSYKDSPQIKITGISRIDKSRVNIDDFCPRTPKDIEELKTKLYNYIDSISNEYLQTLLNRFFRNEKFIELFTFSSAAKQVHHAYIGGLIEHTIAVTDTCESMCKNYPELNRDLLITAAICHDIGKIKEISAFPDNDYTDEGNLLGHIYMGTEMINNQIRKIDGFPKTLGNELKHCILSHHGKLEYGSPKVPELMEAIILNMADDMDAKMRRFIDTSTDDWSDKADFSLGTKIRKTRGE